MSSRTPVATKRWDPPGGLQLPLATLEIRRPRSRIHSVRGGPHSLDHLMDQYLSDGVGRLLDHPPMDEYMREYFS